EHGHGNRVSPAELPVQVGRAEVAGTDGAKIDAPCEPHNDEGGRDRPDQVCDDHGGDQPASHPRDPRRLNFIRIGTPENPHASRKPRTRKRWYDSGTSSGRLVTIANSGGLVATCDAYNSFTGSPCCCGGALRSMSACSTSFTSAVLMRLSRSSATSSTRSSTLRTRWPVSADP